LSLCSQPNQILFLHVIRCAVVTVPGAHGDNSGDDRQEQGRGSEEDKPGEAVVAVALAVDAYPTMIPARMALMTRSESIIKPYLLSHALLWNEDSIWASHVNLEEHCFSAAREQFVVEFHPAIAQLITICQR
jgi:hypothetical protein